MRRDCQNPIGFEFFQHRVEVSENPRAELRQCLSFAHQVEVVFGLDLEQLQRLIEHLTVLGSDAYPRFDSLRLLEQADDGSHFDGFGAGAEDGEDFHKERCEW